MQPPIPNLCPLSLHDALPIFVRCRNSLVAPAVVSETCPALAATAPGVVHSPPVGQELDKSETTDRKSTRLNSSHLGISYAVFCLKKKRTWFRQQLHATAARLV